MVAKRLGVGATPSAAAAAGASENVSEDWTKSIKKQILNVGRKRRHDNIYGAEDDDDDNAADHDNSSSDEEEGRTTAVRERKKKKKTVPVSDDVSSLVVQGEATSTDDTKSKKKKKKGKKERAQEKQAAQNDATESVKVDELAASSSTPSSIKEQSTEVAATATTEETNTQSQKRKRPKKRSRQKNIAKDNRAANDKPSHLVLGRDDYAGRPMTQKTREKLGLGKSKSSMKSSKKAAKLDNAFEKGEWVGEDKPASSSGLDDAKTSADNADVGESVVESSKEEGSLQKIGDCIVDYEPSSSAPDKKKKKREKKMKKKKYKNV